MNAETTHISLGKFLRIIQGCIRRLQTQILTALDQSRFSGNDIKAVHEQNKKILQTAFNIMKNAYDEYSTIFLDYANGKFLKQKSANLRETILAIPEEINKLDSIYYYGSTFQKRFDKLHSSLLDMLKIIISAIDNKKIKNIAILCFPYALFGNTMSYEKLHIFNEETGNYDSYKNICTNPDENIVSLKEYLQDLSKFLTDRKKLTDENIQKVIKKRYILKYDDIKYKIFPQYLKTTYSVMQYWLIQYTHGGEKEIENKLPIVYTYIINEFAKYYKLTKQYWPPLLPESLDYIRKQNIHFEEFLD